MADAAIFGSNRKNWYKKVLLSAITAIWGACVIAIFVLVLSDLSLLVQSLAPTFGYKFAVSDEISKTVIAVGGAVGVALVALYGVFQQNLSAEKRHRVDSSLALRKEIFLEVADAMSKEYRFLLSLAKLDLDQKERNEIVEDIGSAFFKAQVVGSPETVCAMIDANEAWFRALVNIQFAVKGPLKDVDYVIRLAEVQSLATDFMRMLWKFNIVARREIECSFDNDNAYFFAMDERYSRVSKALTETYEKMKAGTVG